MPPIADDSSGDTVFAIGRTVTSGNQQPTYLAVRRSSHGGTLGGVRQLAQKVDWSTLTTDSTGDSIVAWFRYINSAQSAVFGCRVSRPALGPVVKLGLGYVPAITVDPAGAGLVAWQSTPPDSGALTRVYARPFAAATGKFGSQVTLTPDGDYVRLAESWAGSSPPSGSSPRYRGRSAPASAVRRQSLTAAAEVTYRSADLASVLTSTADHGVRSRRRAIQVSRSGPSADLGADRAGRSPTR